MNHDQEDITLSGHSHLPRNGKPGGQGNQTHNGDIRFVPKIIKEEGEPDIHTLALEVFQHHSWRPLTSHFRLGAEHSASNIENFDPQDMLPAYHLMAAYFATLKGRTIHFSSSGSYILPSGSQALQRQLSEAYVTLLLQYFKANHRA